MKKPIFSETKFSLPTALKAQIEKSNAPTQTDIDAAQTKQIEELRKVDEKHDNQFTISILLDMFYLIWLIALTGYAVWGNK